MLFDGTDCCEARFDTGREDLNMTYRSLSGVAFHKRTGKNLNFGPTSFCNNYSYDVDLKHTHERVDKSGKNLLSYESVNIGPLMKHMLARDGQAHKDHFMKNVQRAGRDVPLGGYEKKTTSNLGHIKR